MPWNIEPLKPRRELLWLKEGQKCHWCGKPTRLVDGDAWDQATIDHVIPRYKGGSNDESNLVSACRLCNNRRSHEDARGLPDGHLLGNYNPSTSKSSNIKRVVLTRDEKKAILAGQPLPLVSKSKSAEDVLKEQRDQGLREIGRLHTEVANLKAQVGNYKHKLDTMTFRKLALIKLVKWLQRPESGQK